MKILNSKLNKSIQNLRKKHYFEWIIYMFQELIHQELKDDNNINFDYIKHFYKLEHIS